MKKILIIAICIVNSVIFYGQSKKPERIKPYLNLSSGYFNMHQYLLHIVYYNSYSTLENIYLKTGFGITNHQFKLGLFAQNLSIMHDSTLFMFGIESSGNILNSKDFYLGPLTQIGFCESDYNFPFMDLSFKDGFFVCFNWPTFFSLGLNGGYKFINISVYKQYAGFVANKRSWMAELSVDCMALYRTIKKNDKNESKK